MQPEVSRLTNGTNLTYIFKCCVTKGFIPLIDWPCAHFVYYLMFRYATFDKRGGQEHGISKQLKSYKNKLRLSWMMCCYETPMTTISI